MYHCNTMEICSYLYLKNVYFQFLFTNVCVYFEAACFYCYFLLLFFYYLFIGKYSNQLLSAGKYQ